MPHPWIGIRRPLGLAAVGAALVTALSLAHSVRAGGDAGTKQPAPGTKQRTSAAPTNPVATGGETSVAKGHQGHEGHTMPGMGSASDSAGATGKVMTIVGEVMDPACYLEAGVKSIGPGHFQCAVDCAKSGQTLALYDRAHDRIYFIAGELPGQNPNAPLLRHIHKKVDVTGTVYFRSGVYGIVILKVVPHDEKAADK